MLMATFALALPMPMSHEVIGGLIAGGLCVGMDALLAGVDGPTGMSGGGGPTEGGDGFSGVSGGDCGVDAPVGVCGGPLWPPA